LIQYPSHKVTEMFLAVTIQTAGNMLKMSSSEPTKLIESALGYSGKAEDVTIKPLGLAGTWQVSGKLRLRNGCSDVSRPTACREPTPAGSVYSWDLRKRARALCSGAMNGAEVSSTIDAEGNGISNDGHCRLYGGGRGGSGDGRGDDGGDDGDDDYDDDGHEASATGCGNRRWDPLDEQRLLAWRKEKRSWKWIFDQFPDRTEGAIRVRHNMLKHKERARLKEGDLH
jgi:hypothetical protein